MYNVDPETEGEHVIIGPPRNIAEEDCYSIQARISHTNGGAFDGAPIITTGFKLDIEDLEILNNGGTLTLGFIGEGVPVFILGFKEG